jgi:hypothetical protein
LFGSFGQPSSQSITPSPSLSSAGALQPHAPGSVRSGSFGQPSQTSPVPSPSASAWSALATSGQLSSPSSTPSPSLSAVGSPQVSSDRHPAPAAYASMFSCTRGWNCRTMFERPPEQVWQ